MFQHNALTLSELESIQNSSNLSEAAERLLNVILRELTENIYQSFLGALSETNQHHIVSWLSSAGTLYLMVLPSLFTFTGVGGKVLM